MNLGQLRAWVQANRTALAIAGVGAVGGLALAQRKKAGNGQNTPPAAYEASRSAASTGGRSTSGYPSGYYDSTSSDLYAAIQPQIEYLQRLAEKQANPAVPVPTYADGFYKDLGSGRLYQLKAGALDWLSPAEWKAMKGSGSTVQNLAADDRFWTDPALTRVDTKDAATYRQRK